MKKALIAYWSGTGNTEKMAYAIKKGIENKGYIADIYSVADYNGDMDAYDYILLGCPAMGAEELEESEFVPFFESIKPHIKNKEIGLFGSYGWGDGEWMRTWTEEAVKDGLKIIGDGFICQEDDDKFEEMSVDYGESIFE